MAEEIKKEEEIKAEDIVVAPNKEHIVLPADVNEPKITLLEKEEGTEEDIFNTLNAINVNKFVDKKNGLSYLSWSNAWEEFRKRCPDASYEIERFDGKPYMVDQYGIMVFTKVTTGGQTYEMWLPVMDSGNNAMKTQPYSYKTKYGKQVDVAAATMYDINKAIMRCLVKNLAMFGLGLYIYAGEDLPTDERDAQEEEKKQEEEKRQAEAKQRAEEMKEPIGEELASALEYDLKAWGVGKEFFLMYAKARKLENVTKGQYEWAKTHVDILKAKEAENGKK